MKRVRQSSTESAWRGRPSSGRSHAISLALTAILLATLSGCAANPFPAPGEARRFVGHTGAVSAVALAADGRRAFTASANDGTVRVWDVATGRQLQVLRPPPGDAAGAGTRAVALSPDGGLLVTGGDGPARVWDAATGRHLRAFPDWFGMDTFAFLPDGRHVICYAVDGGANCLCVWDVATGRQTQFFRGHTDEPRSVAVSAGGGGRGTIVSGSLDGTVRVWDLGTGTCRRTLRSGAKWVNAVAVSPDARYALSSDARPGPSATAADGTVRLWDLTSGVSVRSHPATARRDRTVAFSPTGDRYAYADVRVAHVRQTSTGREIATFEHETEVACVMFSADGRWLATAAGLQDLFGTPVDATARLWRLPENATTKPARPGGAGG